QCRRTGVRERGERSTRLLRCAVAGHRRLPDRDRQGDRQAGAVQRDLGRRRRRRQRWPRWRHRRLDHVAVPRGWRHRRRRFWHEDGQPGNLRQRGS
ncbi:hypothetical protein EN788_71530, partial [Mesorhizobium sp. M2D.F.Ca.ET.145.01.1.1]